MPLFEEFEAEAGILKANYPHFRATLNRLYELRMAYAFFATDDSGTPIGLIAVTIADQIFTGDLLASELLWFVTKGHRTGSAALRLLRAAEKEARDLGASKFSMIHLQALTPDKLRDFYVARGYSLTESHYVLPLS